MGIINSLLAIIQYWSIMLFGKIQENMDCIKSHRVNYYNLHQGGCVFAGRHGEVGRSLNNMFWCPCWRHAIWKEWMCVFSPGQLTSWFSDSYFFLFFLVSTHFSFHRAAVLTVWLVFPNVLRENGPNQSRIWNFSSFFTKSKWFNGTILVWKRNY